MPGGEPLPIADDKARHMAAFFVLTTMAAAGFPQRNSSTIFAAMAALGGGIELLQFIPLLHRHAELQDWLADCLASAGALALFRSLGATKRTR